VTQQGKHPKVSPAVRRSKILVPGSNTENR
jgi:hypothetical protein